MNSINWLSLQPTKADLGAVTQALHSVAHLRYLLQVLVHAVLQSFPWTDRDDLVPVFDPSQRYAMGDVVAFPQRDDQELRPDTWRVAHVKAVADGHNPTQGTFQVVTVELDGREQMYAAGLPFGRPFPLDFPPDDAEDLEWLVGDIVNTYHQQLATVVRQAIDGGCLDVILQGGQVLHGDALVTFGPEEQRLIAQAFASLPAAAIPYLTTEELLAHLRKAGRLTNAPDDVACFSLDVYLEENDYRSLGGQRWISIEHLDALNRQVTRRPRVPVVPSRIAQELGEDDAADFAYYEDVELRQGEAQGALEALGEEAPTKTEPVVVSLDEWRRTAPSGPLPLPTLTYQHILEGFFPLTTKLSAAFAHVNDPLLVHIQVVQGEPIPCLVSRGERLIKAVDRESFRRRFLETGIPAGTRLWLERQSDWVCRVVPRPLPRPQSVRCKLVWLAGGQLQFAETEIEMRYEGDPHLFKADLRFEDVDALFQEAEESGLSIFDALWGVSCEWATDNPEAGFHHTELFNAVFFRCRMCSPRSVLTELYTRPCFVAVGDGCFRFEPQRGVRRGPTTRAIRQPPAPPPSQGTIIPRHRIPQIHQPPRVEPQPEGIWGEVAKLVSRELATLDREAAFRIEAINEREVVLVLSTGAEWKSPREQVERAWNELLRRKELPRTWIRDEISEYDAGYIAAILTALPGVTHQTNPIRLFYHQAEDQKTAVLAEPTIERTRSGQLVAVQLVPTEPLFEGTSPSPEEPLPAEPAQPVLPSTTEAETIPPGIADEPPTPPGSRLGRPQAPPPGPSVRTGKSLFSQHYLDHRIREHPEWAVDVAQPFEQLRAHYEAKKTILSQLNEAQTELEFIRPVLEHLGFAYIPQTPTHRAGRVQRPDYALFADEAAKSEAYPLQQDEPAFYARTLAIADAKYWGRPLSEARAADPRDEFKNTNPSFQMVNYLIGTGVDWGILTNGRIWRLYYRQASSTATEFYEVDLVELLGSGDLERFKYFWLFLRREAFTRDAQGRNFLERVREGSATYARVIGDRLQGLVFDEVFPFLSGGFVACGATRGEDVASEATRRLIYEATLSLLYKLLFLLYAEARNLLPMHNPGYRAQSLTRVAQEIASRFDRREPLGQTSTALYDRLLNLFHLVDRGDRGLGLPRYNGGLFYFGFSGAVDREKHRANWFLAQQKMADAFLAPALDLLYRADGEPIDYGFIGVRHLGAIYEGLLEHRLIVDGVAEGQAHLETDKGERKATGSYYTPDYVVKYIVRHTLEPILEERAGRFGELMTQIADVRRELQSLRLAESPQGTARARTLRENLDRLEHQTRETLLDIKVCDPAMGSGHFLVEAVDFLTDGLIEILNQYPEHNPVLTTLDHIRQDIVASLARQGISIDPSRLDDTQLLQRVVMKRCIYGVDLNPMAVELAKVSLWLHSFTIGAPLSFLDHHLRCGNSLIGAMAQEVHKQLSSELPLLGGPFVGLLRAAEIMRGISLLSDTTFTEVEKSEQLFRQFDEAAKPYKRLLDIYVARHFGVKRADEFLRLYGADAIKAGPETVGEPYATVMREARRLYDEKRFFHWDLEFPEVFIDLERATWKENPGFDVVVGNPPWGGEFSKAHRSILQLHFQTARASTLDSYAVFTELALLRAKEGGRCGYIIPDTVLRKDDLMYLREFLLSGTSIVELIETGPVFKEVRDTWCLLVLLARGEPPQEHEIRHRQLSRLIVSPEERLELFGRQQWSRDSTVAQRHWRSRPNLIIGYLASKEQQAIVDSIERQSIPFGQHHLHFGISRGEEGSKLTLESKSDSNFKMVIPELVERYWVGEGIPVSMDSLTPGKLQAYYTRPKIWIIRIQKLRWPQRVVASFEGRTNSAGMKTLQVIVSRTSNQQDLLHLSTLLDSQLMNFWCTDYLVDDMNQSYLEKLPIRRIAFTTPSDERIRLVETGITEATEWIERTEGTSMASVSFSAFSDSNLGCWLNDRLSPVHTPDPELVRRHNADPLNEDWQLPEEGLMEQSDVVHDLLAYLAEQMIEMNKQKQAEVKGFLAWLAREIRAPVDSLTNKTRLRNYLGDYQKDEPHLALEELLGILRQNRRRLQVDPTARAFQERLAQEYQASLDKLLPFKARLAATDRLIDLIVYRLYGLTEQEVAIVEDAQ